jgi:O-antigen ligase
MTVSSSDLRTVVALVLASALAVLVGMVLVSPTSTMALGVVALLAFVLCLPMLLRWHHPLLFFSWNAAIQIFMLPGSPRLWMLMAGISLGITILGSTLGRRTELQSVRSVTWTLGVLLLVVLVTAQLRGGIGIKALGSQTYGGKRYVLLIAAVVGYFALSTVRVPVEKAFGYLKLYCLGTLTLIMSNAAYMLGPSFYWLFLLFPVEFAMDQAVADHFGGSLRRLNGIGFAMVGPFCLMLMSYGICGMMDWRRPWRLLLFAAIMAVSMLAGFRSLLGLYGLLFIFQFWLEGLWRTKLVLVLAAAVSLAAVVAIPFTRHLPLTVQRSLSFLPLDVDPQVRHDAEASSEWRFQMWRMLWGQVPQYLWVGKGFALDPMDLYFAQESLRRGFIQNYETAMIAGDFHSGPLSLLIGFGLPGTLAFVGFLFAGWWVLRANFQRGPPELRRINTFLYAYFLCRVVFFFGVFGDFASDLAHFTGIVGISVALNGDGHSQPVTTTRAKPA